MVMNIETDTINNLVTKHFVRHLINGWSDMQRKHIPPEEMAELVNEANHMYLDSWANPIDAINTETYDDINLIAEESDVYLQSHYLFNSEHDKLTKRDVQMLSQINWNHFDSEQFTNHCRNHSLNVYLAGTTEMDKELKHIVDTASENHLPDWNNRTINQMRTKNLLIRHLIDATLKCYAELQTPVRDFKQPYHVYEQAVANDMINKLQVAYANELNRWTQYLKPYQATLWQNKLTHSNQYFVTQINKKQKQTLIDSVNNTGTWLAKEFCHDNSHMTQYLNFETAIKCLQDNKRVPKYVKNYFKMLNKLEQELYKCIINQ